MSVMFSCKNCNERHVGCHSTCEKYIAEKAENERIRQLKLKESQGHISLHSNGTMFSGRNPSHRRTN